MFSATLHPIYKYMGECRIAPKFCTKYQGCICTTITPNLHLAPNHDKIIIMDVQTTNIFTRQMSRLRRVTLQQHELADGILTQTIGGFIDPRMQYRYIRQITEIRSLCSTLEEKERNKKKIAQIKLSLPAGIVSAVVVGGIGKDSVKEKNGVICIDIDAKDNPAITDWQAFKHEIAKSRFIAYAGLSVSGLGVFAMIPIADPERHEEHYEAIVQDFKKATFTFTQEGESEPITLDGVNLDQSCKDISRKRFVSYDPQPYINTAAQVYCKTYVPPILQPRFMRTYSGPQTWSLRGWLDVHGITYNMRERHGGIQYVVTCPWHELHSSRSRGESVIFEHPNGAVGYKCMHSHCAEKRWIDYREFYEPRRERVQTVGTSRELPPGQIADFRALVAQSSQRSKVSLHSTAEVIAPVQANNPAVGELVEALDLEVLWSPEEVRKWQQKVELEGCPF